MDERLLPGIDQFDLDRPIDLPESANARTADRRDPAVDRDQRPLVVLQIDRDQLIAELARTDDRVELLVLKPRLAHRNPIDRKIGKR